MMRFIALLFILALTMASCAGEIERDQYGRPVCPFGFCIK